MAWRNIIKIRKKQQFTYTGNATMPLATLFKNTSLINPQIITMNQGVIFSPVSCFYYNTAVLTGGNAVTNSYVYYNSEIPTVHLWTPLNSQPTSWLYRNGVYYTYTLPSNRGVISFEISSSSPILFYINGKHRLTYGGGLGKVVLNVEEGEASSCVISIGGFTGTNPADRCSIYQSIFYQRLNKPVTNIAVVTEGG